MSQNKGWKARAETGFGQLTENITRYPWVWLLVSFTLIGLLGVQLKNMRTDTAIESFLDQDSPAIINYNAFRHLFGRDEMFIITVETPEVFDQGFIDKLRQFHNQIKAETPYVDTVDSLVNARHTYGEDDSLIIEDLLPETLPEDPAALQALKDYAYTNPAYENFFISRDRHLVSVIVRVVPYVITKDAQGNPVQNYMTDTQLKEAADGLFKIIAQHQGKLSDDIRMAGSPTIATILNEAIKQDFAVFSGLAILIIGIILYLIFRRWSGVLMPVLVMNLAVVCTIASMAAMNTPLQMTTAILPSFLLAVCVGDSIHLLSIFYGHYDKGESKHDALKYAMEHAGLAMFFTSITTAAGLASFGTSDLTPIAALGIYGGIGTMLAFALTVIIIPALISICPMSRKPVVEHRENSFDRLLLGCVHYSVHHPKLIVGVCSVIMLATLAIMTQLGFSHNPINWLPKDHPAKLALDKTEARLGGTMPIEVVIDTGEEGGATNPELLRRVDAAMKEISSWQNDGYRVAKVISLTDIVKESNRALNNNDPAFYAIPDNKELVRQELFLVEMDAPDDLYRFVDAKYQTLRMTIVIPWVDSLYYEALLDRLDAYLQQSLISHPAGPAAKEYTITGITAILCKTFVSMLYSTGQSYAISGVVITLMMVALVGSVKLGLLSMFPSLLPITIVLSLLHLMGIPLDMFTLLIGSIAIGLTVDNNVHFIHGFRREYALSGDPALAIEKVMMTSGRAMLVTSIVLSAGFLVYTQSALNNMFNFGVMTALCMALALIAVVLLAPALMMLANKKVAVR